MIVQVKCLVEASPVVALDAIGRYEGPTGVTAVSACDIYAFADDRVVTITSYAVEVDPGDPSPGTADRRDRVETVDDA